MAEFDIKEDNRYIRIINSYEQRKRERQIGNMKKNMRMRKK